MPGTQRHLPSTHRHVWQPKKGDYFMAILKIVSKLSKLRKSIEKSFKVMTARREVIALADDECE